MSIPQVIEVAVGLALVYYILGLIVSFLSSRIMEALETRGRDLESHLKKIVGNAQLGALIGQPQLEALAPIRYDGWRGVITGKIKEAKIEKVPVANLVDALFDLYGLAGQPYNADELKALLAGLPDSEAKTNLLTWIDLKVTDVDRLRAKTTMWLSGVMDQAAATYKAHARRFVIGLSLLVTLLFGVDSIDFAYQLWHNSELRAIADAKAAVYLQQKGDTAELGPLVEDLEALSLRAGWWAVPGSLPQTAAAPDWIVWAFKKIGGLTITVAAVSQGSSFWYDILRRLKGENAAPAERGKSGGDSAEQQPS